MVESKLDVYKRASAKKSMIMDQWEDALDNETVSKKQVYKLMKNFEEVLQFKEKTAEDLFQK